ncbi:MAG: NAD-dependent malic enzyme [Dehalococcoidia bacterium]
MHAEPGASVTRYTLTVRVELPNRVGELGRVISAISDAGGDIGAIDLVETGHEKTVRDITVGARDSNHGHEVVQAAGNVSGVRVISASDQVFLIHLGGKIEVKSKIPLRTRADLSMAYTPGVARVCMAIHADPSVARALTIKRNSVAVVTDGTAVLGLGDIGPAAALPVMEGKALLFKEFGGVDAWPVCIDSKDTEEIIRIVQALAPVYGAINLEDISAPRCFEIEQRLNDLLDIPVFHDDQHGTAIVALAALINALKVVGKQPQSIRVVISGAGAAGVACAKIMRSHGVEDIVVCDRQGVIVAGREAGMTVIKRWLAENTNPRRVAGTLLEAMEGADVFLGVSGANIIEAEDLRRMAADPIVFALANPDPEVDPVAALKFARVMATGRSDFPNQINNVLAFPGIMRGALDSHAREINEAMKVAAANAIAALVSAEELSAEYIVPSVFNPQVATAVAHAVEQAAYETGAATRSHQQAAHYL